MNKSMSADGCLEYVINYPLKDSMIRELDEELDRQHILEAVSNRIEAEKERRRMAQYAITPEGVHKLHDVFRLLKDFAEEFFGELRLKIDYRNFSCTLSLELDVLDLNSPPLKQKFILILRDASLFSIEEKADNRFALVIGIDLFQEINKEAYYQ